MKYSDLALIKISNDPYYGSALRHFNNTEFLKPAGFFDDEIEQVNYLKYLQGDTNWMTTPLHKIFDNLNEDLVEPPYAILVTTGGFAPIHNGHLDMMEKAKLALEKKGYAVLGGYISPSHDKYVSQRFADGSPMLIDHRLHMCELAVADSSWLMVDPWEGRYVKTSINFTDVLVHLEKYVTKHIKFPVDVFYVFGGDNAKFADAFIKHGHCVCVTRSGFKCDVDEIVGRIIVTEGSSNASARNIRAGFLDEVPSAISKDLLFGTTPHNTKKIEYLIREDDSYAISNWKHVDNATMFKFKMHVRNFIQGSFKQWMNVNFENFIFGQTKIDEIKGNIINLDTASTGGIKVGVSRLFNLSDGQLKSNSMISRPGMVDVWTQIKRIPAGDYTLVDDDLATGLTVQTIKNILEYEKQIKITNEVFLLESKNLFDVVDLRDFLVGSKDGGLVVSLPNNKIARVPYMFPYVCLHTRAKIPLHNQMKFSLAMWKANLEFFDKTNIEIMECDSAFKEFASYIGWPQGKMTDFCKYHIDRLKEAVDLL